jgi:hypothetical protein
MGSGRGIKRGDFLKMNVDPSVCLGGKKIRALGNATVINPTKEPSP